MNFLNSDFSTSREIKLPSVQDFRDFYVLTIKRPTSSLEPPANALYPDNTFTEGKAGLFSTFFWNTVVLGERSAKNYSRNLLAYGVRAGMYAGEYILGSLAPIF
jgi:hypothetical protein